MSKTLALLLVCTCVSAPLSAQDSLVARLQHRADSLLRSWREAALLANVADSLERERSASATDTIAVGGVRILTNRSPLPLRAAAERAWPVLDSMYGSAALELTEHPYIIRGIDTDTAVRRGTLHVGLEVPWDLDVRATAKLLLNTVTPPRFDRGLADWLGTALRPRLDEGDEGSAVFLQLVTAPLQAVRACFLGDVARCKDVLQLTDTAGLLERWYETPAEREILVTESFADYFARGATDPTLQRCRRHDDDACTTLLRSLPPNTLPRPLRQDARLLLVREALRVGGRDAYGRLVADPHATIGARLASAARIDVDSLVKRWHARALGSRTAPLTVSWWTAIAAIGWTTVFGICALRSSRWRL